MLVQNGVIAVLRDTAVQGSRVQTEHLKLQSVHDVDSGTYVVELTFDDDNTYVSNEISIKVGSKSLLSNITNGIRAWSIQWN